MTWKTILDILDALDNQDIMKADNLMRTLPPGEALHQETLSDSELKQQILSVAPNVNEALRSLREYYLRKDKKLKDLL